MSSPQSSGRFRRFLEALEAWIRKRLPMEMGWPHTLWFLLTFLFLVQASTGIILWMFYSPSTQTAWESVFYLQHKVPGGWLIRGIHYWSAECMVVVAALLVMLGVWFKVCSERVIRDHYLALCLAMITLALAMTGYLLPWDQHGYWSAKIRTHLMGLTPIIGSSLERLMLGGESMGHLTLTRFLAFHAGLLPVLFWIVLRLRSKSIASTSHSTLCGSHRPYWPRQAWSDTLYAGLLGWGILILAWQPWSDTLDVSLRGAPLSAPVDPSAPYPSARPEWYFLFLFQFLKYFPGNLEIVGAILIPSLILSWLVVLPWLGKGSVLWRTRRPILAALAGGIIWLSIEAIQEDRRNETYQLARSQAKTVSLRARELAMSMEGIPTGGALTLLQEDAKTQGPRLFAAHCASCHRFQGHDGLGNPLQDPPSASDLSGFGSRAWITGLLNPQQIQSPQYFGGTAFIEGEMTRFTQRKIGHFDQNQEAALRNVINILSAEAELPSQQNLEGDQAQWRSLDRDELFYEIGCTECHPFHFEDDELQAPDLTGYGSREWLISFISEPESSRFYGEQNDRMPSYRTEDILTEKEIGLIVDWLRMQ